MASYSFSELALQDIRAICEYVAKDDARVASRLFDRIRAKCKLVADFPRMGKSYERLAPDLRAFIVDGYLVFYFPREDGINVSRVINGYRDLPSIFEV
jgi:toxin ParE1/3/4